MTAAVLSGEGVGLCPTASIQQELAQGEMVQSFDIAADADKSYWLLGADQISPQAKHLRDWLVGLSVSHEA